MEIKTKQVIVVRKDLGMLHGKFGAQVAHASMGALLASGYKDDMGNIIIPNNQFNIDTMHWLDNSFTKIVLAVDSEEELLDIYNKSKDAGLRTILITDNGTTMFEGVPTKTCVGIGPHYVEEIDKITKHLKRFR